MSKVAVLCFSLATVCLGGCSDSAPFSYVPVSGRVTYEDGTAIPASGMKLQFEPLDAQTVNGMHPRIATADLDSEGRFSNATSHKYGDGLVPGKHKVAIGYATDKNGNLLIPKEDASLGETQLTVDTANLPFEIKVPKP